MGRAFLRTAGNRTPRWYIDYRDHLGKRIRKPVRAHNERDANKLLAIHEARETQLEWAGGLGGPGCRTNEVEVGSLLGDYLLHTLSTRRYGTVRAWSNALAATVGRFAVPNPKLITPGTEQFASAAWPPRQITSLADALEIPRRFELGPLGARTVVEITPARVENWAARQDGQGRTVLLRLQSLKAFLNWAVAEGRIASNPVRGVRLSVRASIGRWRALSSDEAARLLDASPEPYNTLWLAFLNTGVRRGELTGLTWPDVSFSTNTIRVRSESCKTHRQRDIPMVPELRRRLEALHRASDDPQGHVFFNVAGNPWRENLDLRFRKCLRRAGIGPRVEQADGSWWYLDADRAGQPIRQKLDGCQTRADAEARKRDLSWGSPRVVLHSLRHTFATELIRQGVNPKVVSDLLGHTTVKMTLDTYAHVWPSDREAAVGKLDFGSERGAIVAPRLPGPAQPVRATGT